jgi:hypothetical protein
MWLLIDPRKIGLLREKLSHLRGKAVFPYLIPISPESISVSQPHPSEERPGKKKEIAPYPSTSVI